MWLSPADTFRTILADLGWLKQDESPLYTDDQRFVTAAGEYGPHAKIAPATELNVMSGSAFRPAGLNGTLVGVLYVTPDSDALATPPAEYTELGLVYGLNCLYLRESAGVWQGFTAPGSESPRCAPTYSDDEPLAVKKMNNDDFPGGDNIPPVARFHEGVNTQRHAERVPYFGLRCDDGWCLFLPPGLQPVDPPQFSDDVNAVQWRGYGWGDAQHLSESAPSAGGAPHLFPTAQHSFIVPVAGLESMTMDAFTHDYVKVATVVFVTAEPAGEYENRWHFARTRFDNEIELKALDANANSWTGRVSRRAYILGIPLPWKRHFGINVDRAMHPDVIIPGTARFLWDPHDEGLWVRCPEGCCKLTPQ